MNSEPLFYKSVTDLIKMLRSGCISAVELVETYLKRIEDIDSDVRAYITVCADESRAKALEADSLMARGESHGPLHGVPIAVKDQFNTKGIRTTMGSKIYAENIPEEDATVVSRLNNAGAILLGKLNLTEFAFGDTREYVFGTPRNPWDLNRNPGMSSSGSGIAAAAGLAAATIGEDTGGSVRMPASMCGVVGLRPTFGRVSRYGVFPMCWSMDIPGPMTRTVSDCALMLQVISGHDPKDRVSSRRHVEDYSMSLGAGIEGLRIGYLPQLVELEGVHPETRNAVNATRAVFKDLGAKVIDVSIPMIELAGPMYIAICDSDAADYHEDLMRSRHKEYDVATRTRLLAASLLPASMYHLAQRARELLRLRMLNTLETVDVLVSPVTAEPALPIKEVSRVVDSEDDVRARIFGARALTTPYNLAGLPAISIPCGFTTDGLPIGLQIGGRAFDEATIIRVSYAYEQATRWHKQRPSI